ncbi:MAG: hypothetical protein LBS45_08380 [Synergistaceae bacterium]|jgi:hypothetical protein|nr:hypothetical protein [Synergistaceae bacterium]
MSNAKDYYFILGISKTASLEEVERAYRYALDVIKTSDLGSFADSGNYQSMMLRDINEAYECLRDPALRRNYDSELGAAAPSRSRPEQINPALGTTNTKETIELCFAAMKKKKSRSIPAIGRFLTALLFLACVGGSAVFGLDFFKAGKFSFGPVKSETARTIPVSVQPAQSTGNETAQTAKTPALPAEGYVRVYDIRYGGVVSAANAVCREKPSQNAKISVRMPRNAVVFVTKESKDGDGAKWYFVDCNAGKGWVREEDLKIYK